LKRGRRDGGGGHSPPYVKVMADSTATTKRGPPRTDVDSCCPKRVQGLVPAEGLGVSPNSSFLYPPRMGARGLIAWDDLTLTVEKR